MGRSGGCTYYSAQIKSQVTAFVICLNSQITRTAPMTWTSLTWLDFSNLTWFQPWLDLGKVQVFQVKGPCHLEYQVSGPWIKFHRKKGGEVSACHQNSYCCSSCIAKNTSLLSPPFPLFPQSFGSLLLVCPSFIQEKKLNCLSFPNVQTWT